MQDKGIVEYFGLGGGHRCGYCGQTDTNISHGMWAHQLTCENYEDLINRGWRRSGKYVYKPLMNQLCCPMYTIRCDVTGFKISKSQKKVLKKMRKYLIDGKEPHCTTETHDEETKGASSAEASKHKKKVKTSKPTHLKSQEDSEKVSKNRKFVDGGNNKPCKKAKEIRRENKLKKIAERQAKGEFTEPVDDKPCKKIVNCEKTLEELINIPEGVKLAHKLEVKSCRVDTKSGEFTKNFQNSFELFCQYQKVIHKDPAEKLKERRAKTVQSCPKSKEFLDTFQNAYTLFKNYQMKIHKEDENENDVQQFKRFLVDGPLIAEEPGQGIPNTGLGAFHQQYYIDGKLIAVGVIDILPHCLSSKYFFYDPEYSFLSLGVYSSLREIYFVRKLQQHCPEFKYYYMGYYIHTCQKMRYKGQYEPSYLLCPEAYTFQQIKSCIPKLDVSNYARLDPREITDSEVKLEDVLVLCDGNVMTSIVYLQLYVQDEEKETEIEQLKEYAKLSGTSSKSMLIYRAVK